MDTPQDDLAAQTISAANRLVLVARPALEGAHRAAAAYKMVSERLNGHFSPQAIYVVVNGLHARDRLSADNWQRAATERLGREFPAIITCIPFDIKIGNAQDRREIPIEEVKSLAKGLRPLVVTMLRAVDGQEKPLESRFGPFRVIR
ncbi:MAG: hypothetical protein HN423_08250 [Alphaproteobacteria bacterium]|nr:hypothetical protein [Alphaproteobacteria bacterium]